MFSKENRRFTFSMIALIFVAALGINGVFKLLMSDHQAVTYIFTGFVMVIFLQVLQIAKQEQLRTTAKQSGEEAKRAREEITNKVEKIEEKTNGNLTKAIQQVAVEVKKAKYEPAPGQEQMPRTPEELQSLLKIFADGICNDYIKRTIQEVTPEAAKKATETATKHMVETVVRQLDSLGLLKGPLPNTKTEDQHGQPARTNTDCGPEPD